MSGGLVEVNPAPLIGKNQTQGIYLISDLHIGGANTDYNRIERELSEALSRNDRILIGGDVLDLILPKDSRRYQPGAVHHRISHRDDLVNASIEWAAELLEPYAENIDAIGLGNHETEVIKRHSVDPVREIIQKLRPYNQRIAYLGYTGYINYKLLATPAARKGYALKIWFTHGAGGSSSEAASINKLTRQAHGFDADVYWCGHYHAKAAVASERIYDGKLSKDVYYILTGGFVNPYGTQGQASIQGDGHRNNYGSEAAFTPRGRGGVRLLLECDDKGWTKEIKVLL